jgi:hypothetical protein
MNGCCKICETTSFWPYSPSSDSLRAPYWSPYAVTTTRFTEFCIVHRIACICLMCSFDFQHFDTDTEDLAGLQWSPDGRVLAVWDSCLQVMTKHPCSTSTAHNWHTWWTYTITQRLSVTVKCRLLENAGQLKTAHLGIPRWGVRLSVMFVKLARLVDTGAIDLLLCEEVPLGVHSPRSGFSRPQDYAYQPLLR